MNKNRNEIPEQDLNMIYIIFKSGKCKLLNELSDFEINEIRYDYNYKDIKYIGGLKKQKDQNTYCYHGKGFLFFEDSPTLSCESYFQNGKRHGYTIEYDRDSYILYRGNYFKGKKMGHGEIFFPKGKVQFAGVFEQNKLGGLGLEYDFDTKTNLYYCKYIGTFRNNKFDGKGTLYTSQGFPLYDGEFSKGLLHGKATQYITNSHYVLYKGDFKRGEANGFGEIYTLDDDNNNHHYLYYKGEFFKGSASGYGCLFDSNSNLIYEGSFHKSQPHFRGTMLSNGLIEYDGQMKNGNRHGKGVAYMYTSENITRSKYEGHFFNNKMHGQGEKILYKYNRDTDTNSKFMKLVGEFVHGKFTNGTQFVCEIDNNHNELWLPFYNGSFQQSKEGFLQRHGNGILYEPGCITSGSFSLIKNMGLSVNLMCTLVDYSMKGPIREVSVMEQQKFIIYSQKSMRQLNIKMVSLCLNRT